MPRANQNDCRENLDGKGKDECIQRQNRRDRASERKEKSEEPGNEEQMADRHAVASGEENKQHEVNRMRDIRMEMAKSFSRAPSQ